MRVPPEIVTTTLMVMGMVMADHYLPQATLEVQVYPRLSDAEFSLMRKEAKAFAKARGGEGVVVSSRDESARYFELRANEKPVMLVDNSVAQLMVMVAGDSQERVPDLRNLQQQWRVRALPDWERRR
ncbi:hypothetical protein JAK44_05145 [Stenotrophomonas maltophilia]|uniref:hypothetical protein n=1 Tax=Stenotrophomonas TaxID=40323 RepID=UPI0021C79787|nr:MULTISPECIES: hypothetical protein [Stenotrophomonas]MCU1000348.1 hypothetical protein [Stenotrophomonas maltophilia]